MNSAFRGGFNLAFDFSGGLIAFAHGDAFIFPDADS